MGAVRGPRGEPGPVRHRAAARPLPPGHQVGRPPVRRGGNPSPSGATATATCRRRRGRALPGVARRSRPAARDAATAAPGRGPRRPPRPPTRGPPPGTRAATCPRRRRAHARRVTCSASPIAPRRAEPRRPGGCRSAVRDIVWRAWPLKPISRSPPPPRSAGRCAGRATAPPSTSPRPPSCSPPAANSSTSCSRRRPASATPGSSTRAGRASSPTPARSSSRSPGCAATAATTARSPPCRTGCPPRSSSATRCWRSPARARRRAARRPCSRSATARRSAGPPPASGSRPAATTPHWSTCAPAPSRCWRRPGLLPHLNPGVMSWEELTRLKPVAPSMGMMLETTATRLWSEPGGPHYGSPDKEPAVRLRTLTDAGRVGVPFTTGILIGIGENREERAESLFAIRARRAGARAHPGGDRPELPGQARHGDGERPGRRPRRPRRHHRRRPPRARAEDARAGAAQPRRRGVRPDAPRGHRRLGRGLAGHRRPRQPRAALARHRRARRPFRGSRFHAPRAAHGVPEVRARGLAVDRRPAARARRGAGRPFWSG